MDNSHVGPQIRRAATSLALACLVFLGFSSLGLLVAPRHASAQSSTEPAVATIDSTAEAGEADGAPKRSLVKWNEYDGPISTARFGYLFVYDAASYTQDDASRRQVTLESPDHGLRDFRVTLKGRFKTKRPISWAVGYMYDAADKNWHFRTTGFQVDLPEISGRVFVGRTKEGYSMAKVMVGAYIVSLERAQTLDAFIPILADGIKYMGYYPRQHMFLSLGYFTDGLTAQSEKEKFALYDNQAVVRLGWQPILSEQKVLHLAVMARDTKPDDGKIRLKSRPGAWLAPYFIDTGTLTSDRSHTYGLEANYRSGSWLFASEYDWQDLELAGGGKPMFHGGEVTATWLITGEVRPYNKVGGFYQQVTPKRSVFEGGRGALEATLGVTYNDFNEGNIDGGKFWRVTPTVQWHLSSYLRFEAAYGYGELDRFGRTGRTQFFQGRFVSLL